MLRALRRARQGYKWVLTLLGLFVAPFSVSAGVFQFDDGGKFRTGVGGGLIVDTNLLETVSTIVKAALGVVGVIMVILVIYSGFSWMLSRGNEQGITTAKDVLRFAILGLVIVLLSYAIVYLFFQVFTAPPQAPDA